MINSRLATTRAPRVSYLLISNLPQPSSRCEPRPSSPGCVQPPSAPHGPQSNPVPARHVDPRVSSPLRHRSAVRRGAHAGALASGLGLPALRYGRARCRRPGCAKALQCNGCRHQASLTAGRLMQHTKPALTTWFLAIYLISQAKTGLSALALKRQLGVSYPTAWPLHHKINSGYGLARQHPSARRCRARR